MKKKKFIALVVLSCLALTGCGNKIPEMTQQEQDMITEYAAGILLKYSSDYEDKILVKDTDTAETVEPDDDDESAQISTESVATESEAEISEGETDELANVPTVSVNESAVKPQLSLSDFFDIGNLGVEYAGFEICDSYSGAQEGELAFEMMASEGNKLLVAKFVITNNESTEQVFDLFSKNVKAEITVSGTTKKALLTMLENDLLTVNENIPANGEKTYVIVVEIPSENAEGLNGIDVSFSYADVEAEYQFGR